MPSIIQPELFFTSLEPFHLYFNWKSMLKIEIKQTGIEIIFFLECLKSFYKQFSILLYQIKSNWSKPLHIFISKEWYQHSFDIISISTKFKFEQKCYLNHKTLFILSQDWTFWKNKQKSIITLKQFERPVSPHFDRIGNVSGKKIILIQFGKL